MTAKNKIKVGIIGVGNCAKALVEGTQYYTENPEDTIGLMYPDIGGYTASDIEFVVGFDVDKRKVNTPLVSALRSLPNCAMDHVDEIREGVSVAIGAMCYQSPEFDGVAPYMLDFPEPISYRPAPVTSALGKDRILEILKETGVEILVNYMPVGTEEGSRFWVDIAVDAGIDFVNCIPTMIDTATTQVIEQSFIDAGRTFVGSDMRSAWGASRLSEVLQGAMIDSGLLVTQHIQMNMAAGSTQGQEHIRTGRTANTDFLSMAEKWRLEGKHRSKENVLRGQNEVRNVPYAGMTMYAGPSLTVFQKPGGQYVGSDNKIANLDIVAYGFGGARYELSARLSVQDSANSGGVVISALRFCRVAHEMGVVGCLRGPSAWTQKTPQLQLSTADAKFECDAMARRVLTPMTEKQLAKNNPKAVDLAYTFASTKTDYE